MKKIDLHIHTTASDGTYTPTELVDYAIKKGLSAIAITDHDTMQGIQNAIDYITTKNYPLEIIPGMEISAYDYKEKYGVHLLAYFVNKNSDQVKDILKNLEIDLKKSSSSPKEVISIVSKYGGIVSLAHPQEYGLSMNSLDKLVSELASYGLSGVEGYYTTHSENYINDIKNIISKYNLIITGGTDFHGQRKPSVDLGCGFGDLIIPYTIVETMKSIV